MSPQSYERYVVQACRENAIRNVLLIDNDFPTFEELANRERESPEYKERDVALKLYKFFREAGLHCDVENSADRALKEVDRIRKGDLIVLDYHLTGDSQDGSKALDILAHLADSPNLNLVLVYTKEDVSVVFRQIVLALSGCCSEGSEMPIGCVSVKDTAEKGRWRDLETLDEDLLLGLLSSDLKTSSFGNRISEFKRNARSLSVPSNELSALLRYFVHSARRSVPMPERLLNGCRRTIRGRKDQNPWLMCKNAFIAIASKANDAKQGCAPDELVKILDAALTDWNPNALRVILCDFQNRLEQDAWAFDDECLELPDVQAGLFYHILRAVKSKDGRDYTLDREIRSLLSRLVETGHRKFLKGDGVRFGRDVFNSLIEKLDGVDCPSLEYANDQQLIEFAKECAGLSREGHSDVLHALNGYLSCQPFVGDHLTCGTIFRKKDESGDSWWVCTTPVCDMVPREKSGWARRLSPLVATMTIKLLKCGGDQVNSRLEGATHGRTLFLMDKNEKRLCFEAIDEDKRVPRVEMFLVADLGRVEGTPGQFLAYRLTAGKAEDESDKPSLESDTYEVVAQLRPDYANRLLQAVGNNQSRVGVDFAEFSLGQPVTEPVS